MLFHLFTTALLASAAFGLPSLKSWSVSQCSALSTTSISTDGFHIINATYVDAQSLNVSSVLNDASFCRVYGEVAYPQHNSVLFEVWLPESGSYNGRFLVVGNGGMAGTIDEASLMTDLNKGYAVAGGNSGHLASLNNDGSGAPGVYLPYLHDKNQVLAWIHNSIALLTPPAKLVVETLYKSAPKHTYYQGCSTGGAQGFALAQFHPELFDGIVAGSPGNWYSHLALSFLWNTVSSTSPYYLSQDTLDLITSAVLAECDSLDGVEDGVLENPSICNFDVTSLACSSSAVNASSCLNSTQLSMAQKIYRGPHDSRDSSSIYPGFSVGSETEWLVQEVTLADAFSIPILQNLVYDNLSYDAATFNWGSDVDLVDQRAGTLIDEITPDLSAFKARGGKLIVTQGWADPYNAAVWPIEHLKQIETNFGGDVSHWFELFMVPGGGHCGAASNYPQVPANWHSLESLVDWVETGEIPRQMLASDPSDGTNRTRKLCPFPKTSHYLGGDADCWTSYACEI